MRPSSRTLYVAAIAGIILYVLLDAIAQLLPPHYSPISQAESDLAVGKFGYVMTVNFLNRGIFSFEFLFALTGTIRLAGGVLRRHRLGFALIGIWSAGALLLAAFPTDVPATPVSWHGAIHLVVAALAFAAAALGALILSLQIGSYPSLRKVRRFALPVSVLAALLCIAELGAPFLAPHFVSNYGGLVERLFLGSVLLWITIVSVLTLRGLANLTPSPVRTEP